MAQYTVTATNLDKLKKKDEREGRLIIEVPGKAQEVYTSTTLDKIVDDPEPIGPPFRRTKQVLKKKRS